MNGHCRTHPDTPADASCARCGDFLCVLCGATSPLPICARCAARGSVDWEEEGEQSWGRSLFTTFREALLAPHRLGTRLGGAGRAGLASLYAAVCAALGLVPLAMLTSGLMLTVADPKTLGMRSTSLLSSAVFLVLFAVGVASALPLLLSAWCALLWLGARVLGVQVRLDVLVRASAYGLSPLAIPLFGPVLLPLALLWMLLCVHGALATASSAARATASLLLTVLLLALPWALRFAG